MPLTFASYAACSGGNAPNIEGLVYFYHPDHLGSSSYITDANGEVAQHLEYFAFGETFVEEHSNKDRTPYLYNAKELDEETGLYYYGARYYDPVSSVFYGVDPPALDGTYLDGQLNSGFFNPRNLSIYSYTYQNPIILTDPDGRNPIPPIRLFVVEVSSAIRTEIPKIKSSLISSPPGQIIGAAKDFSNEYSQMRSRNIIGNDHYHHANANSRATQRGSYGEATAKVISDAREAFDYLKGDTRGDMRQDQAANQHGRNIPEDTTPYEWNAKYDHTRGGKRETITPRPDDNRTLRQDIGDFINSNTENLIEIMNVITRETPNNE